MVKVLRADQIEVTVYMPRDGRAYVMLGIDGKFQVLEDAAANRLMENLEAVTQYLETEKKEN